MTSTTMTIRLPLDVSDKLSRLAKGTDRSRSYLAAAALSAYVDRELEIIEGIQQGLADVESGRVIPHEQVVARAEAIIAEAREARAKR
ncbi:CopG family ribbon-helix-helix protein [Sphingomonas sp. 35-24ZXX]|jgi:predicted transcriptional regulator|uniref:CopG family ribbon-helix-helix protein n=1 Tax=Sphingomonas sp. 35-24ZXX TaxID=1545915 RepID=UPI00053BF5AF|nr:ribbon-helix-helix protein, CopG family [Sphingomonas sp. 35-24ZXX]